MARRFPGAAGAISIQLSILAWIWLMADVLAIEDARRRLGARRRGVHGAWLAPGQKDDAGGPGGGERPGSAEGGAAGGHRDAIEAEMPP